MKTILIITTNENEINEYNHINSYYFKNEIEGFQSKNHHPNKNVIICNRQLSLDLNNIHKIQSMNPKEIASRRLLDYAQAIRKNMYLFKELKKINDKYKNLYIAVEETSLNLPFYTGYPGPSINELVHTTSRCDLYRILDFMIKINMPTSENPVQVSSHIVSISVNMILKRDFPSNSFIKIDESNFVYGVGMIKGRIGEPRGHYGYNFDFIFYPENDDKSISEYDDDDRIKKNSFRRFALDDMIIRTN
jgi:inosine/xanthosine triphosphate pyrophosphatase family protein